MKAILTFTPDGRYACDGLGALFSLLLEGALQEFGCEQCPKFAACRLSHWTSLKTEIKDLEALKRACAEMGFGFLEKAEARGYYQNKQKAPYVIRLQGPYDIAVTTDGGAIALTTDWWAGHVAKEVGENFGR